LLLEKQTDDIQQKLDLQKNTLNIEIENFNNASDNVENEYCKWKERIKHNNDEQVSFIDEVQEMMFTYQQKMYVVVKS